MKLTTLRSPLSAPTSRLAQAPTRSDKRITGRTLQARRLRLWTRNPHCVDCQRLTDYPSGFELDHEIPLEQGGKDTDENCRIRCVWWDTDGSKQGCHEAKTKREARTRWRIL